MTQDSAPEQKWCGDLEPHGPHHYTRTDNLFALGVCDGREPTRSQEKRIAAITEHQQDAGEEEWEKRYDLHVGYYIVNSLGQAVCDGPEDYIDQIIADHAAARRARKLEAEIMVLQHNPNRSFEGASELARKFLALEERVRELEAAATYFMRNPCNPSRDEDPWCGAHQQEYVWCRATRALLSPATGKEEAG